MLRSLFLISLIMALYVGAWIIQSDVYFNRDVSWLTEAARRLLAGGSYNNDFFENNPPLILYLYLPSVALTRLTQINIMFSLRIYVFILAAISLLMSYQLMKKLFVPADKPLADFLLLSLAAIFLILPMGEFGQREHLLLLLTMPYLFLLACRLKGIKINPVFAGFSGLLAALGFYLKPYFLITLILVEAFYILQKKNLLAWRRIEIYAMLGVLLVYIAIILLRHQDYLFNVIPYALHWCALGNHDPLRMVISDPLLTFCGFAAAMTLLKRGKHPYDELATILTLALIGFVSCYLLQMSDWFYHLLPAFSLAVFIFIFLFSVSARSLYSRRDILLTSLYGVALLITLYLFMPFMWNIIVFNPLIYFSYLLAILFAVYCLANGLATRRSVMYGLLLTLFVFLTGYAFNFVIFSSWLYTHAFPLTSLYMIIIFCLCMRADFRYSVTATLAIMVFSLPAYATVASYFHYAQIKNGLHTLIEYYNEHAKHGSIYVFATDLIYSYSAVNYAVDTHSVSRFSYFYGLPGMVKQSLLPMDAARYQQLENDKNYFINMIAEDLSRNKPELVLIDVNKTKNGLVLMQRKNGKGIFQPLPFDYLDYFSQHEQFRNAWRHYHYLTTINGNFGYDISGYRYELAVYQRSLTGMSK